MNYYLDTEFLEGTQKKWFGQTKPTIDLISIGIVCEDGREYYAVSKDFNLKEAWNRYDLKKDFGKPQGLGDKKVYWIRENVLKPIWEDLKLREYGGSITRHFTFNNFKWLINEYGKTNKQIAADIRSFTGCITPEDSKYIGNRGNERIFTHFLLEEGKEVEWQMDLSIPDKDVKKVMWQYYDYCAAPECRFYGYYSDYDWVVFCWLFGKMIDLPKGFPMYCIDLKQILDEKLSTSTKLGKDVYQSKTGDLGNLYIDITKHKNYPKQINEHNALADAKWNKELHNFLKTL